MRRHDLKTQLLAIVQAPPQTPMRKRITVDELLELIDEHEHKGRRK